MKYLIEVRNVDTSEVKLTEVRGSFPYAPLAAISPIGRLTISVRAISTDGTESNWSQPLSYIGQPSSRILSPTASTMETSPDFQWSPVAGAVSYDLVVRNVDKRSVQFTVRAIAATKYTPSALPLGNYELWVIANGANKLRGTWSSQTFQIVGPPKPDPHTLYPYYYYGVPLDLALWLPLSGADHYEVLISNPQDIAAVRDVNVRQTFYTLSTVIARGSYRVRVRADYSDATMSPWSDPEWFTVS